MIVPSKVTSLDDSIIGKMSFLIIDGEVEISIKDLLDLRLKSFSDIGEFILALDALYVLGKIDIEESRGMVRYVK